MGALVCPPSGSITLTLLFTEISTTIQALLAMAPFTPDCWLTGGSVRFKGSQEVRRAEEGSLASHLSPGHVATRLRSTDSRAGDMLMLFEGLRNPANLNQATNFIILLVQRYFSRGG